MSPHDHALFTIQFNDLCARFNVYPFDENEGVPLDTLTFLVKGDEDGPFRVTIDPVP